MREPRDSKLEITGEPYSSQGIKQVEVTWNGHKWTMPLSNARLIQRLQAEGVSDNSVDEIMDLVNAYVRDEIADWQIGN